MAEKNLTVETQNLDTENICDGIKIEQYKDESELASVMRLITDDLSEPYSIYTYRYFINNWPRFCLIARDTKYNPDDPEFKENVCKHENMENGHDSQKTTERSGRHLNTETLSDSPSNLENRRVNALEQTNRSEPHRDAEETGKSQESHRSNTNIPIDRANHVDDAANYVDPSIIGSVVCKLDAHKGTSRGYVAMLAVHSKYRRRGIATQLVCEAIKCMRNEGCEEVVLETEVTNAAALRFYEKLGFLRDKRLYRYYLNGVDALRLKLWLTPPECSSPHSPTHQSEALHAAVQPPALEHSASHSDDPSVSS